MDLNPFVLSLETVRRTAARLFFRHIKGDHFLQSFLLIVLFDPFHKTHHVLVSGQVVHIRWVSRVVSVTQQVPLSVNMPKSLPLAIYLKCPHAPSSVNMPKSSALAIYLKYKTPVHTCPKCTPPGSNLVFMCVGANCVMLLP